MKKLLIIVAISLSLTGCFSSNTVSPANNEMTKIDGFNIYDSEEFTLQVPAEWETLTQINFKSDTPANTAVAFRSNMRNPKFTANVAIVKNTLTKEVTTRDYAVALYQKITNDLIDVKPIAIEESKILVGGAETDTIFIYVEGRNEVTGDKKKFIEIAGVKGLNAYIAVGSFLSAEDEGVAKKVESAVRSLRVK